ncbi:hypothetical protein ACSSS7_006691 [Eimeria intestinalis]
MAFEQHVVELKWMDSSLRAAAEQMRRDGLTSSTPAAFAGVADRLRAELSPKGPASAGGVADLFRLWLSGTERLATVLGPGQAALGELREFLLGVERVGQAWSTAIVPSAPTAVAPHLSELILLINTLQTSSRNRRPWSPSGRASFRLCFRYDRRTCPRRTHWAWMAWPMGLQARVGTWLERPGVIVPLLSFWRRRTRLRSVIAPRGGDVIQRRRSTS